MTNLPGYDLTLDFYTSRHHTVHQFPHLLDPGAAFDDRFGRLHTFREIIMMRLMNAITDQPDWVIQVRTGAMASRWCYEAADLGMTLKMIDWILEELKWKVNVYEEAGHVVVFDSGVTKSDTCITADIHFNLQQEVRKLEKCLETKKNHPRTGSQIVNLVTPSLFPVVFGRTRLSPDQDITLANCLNMVGKGNILSAPTLEDSQYNDTYGTAAGKVYNTKYQWLPCDVEVHDNKTCSITSYVNNLHPTLDSGLYRLLERVIARAIPLWNATLTCVNHLYYRLDYGGMDDDSDQSPSLRRIHGVDIHAHQASMRYWNWNRPLSLFDPGPFRPSWPRHESIVDLWKRPDRKLQVIVKMVNIELTPEKHEYRGENWHIEGQLNEHICAVATYCYDSENVTEHAISFRQRPDINLMYYALHGREGHHDLQEDFGMRDNPAADVTSYMQELGSVVAKEGRLVCFANVLEHCMTPFALKDRAKPGYKKFLALFLVDPETRVISSASVPPQREDWAVDWIESVSMVLLRLPGELINQTFGYLQVPFMGLDEAKCIQYEILGVRDSTIEEQTVESEAESSD